MLKKIITALSAPFILSLILLAVAGVKNLSQPSFELGKTPTISVSGEGKAKAKPDVAEINFSVVNQGTDPAVLQKGNDARMATALEFLKSQGVREEDIKTTGYNLSPQYEFDRDGTKPPRIIGYTLTQSVSAKIRDLPKIGTIVGGLSEKGVNQINSIVFTVDNPDPFKAKARQEAIGKALTQANEIAASLGVRLGSIVNFSESPVFIPVPYAQFGGFGGGKGGGEISPIQPGIEEIAVMVNITYAIR